MVIIPLVSPMKFGAAGAQPTDTRTVPIAYTGNYRARELHPKRNRVRLRPKYIRKLQSDGRAVTAPAS